jgi:hypothetical protein
MRKQFMQTYMREDIISYSGIEVVGLSREKSCSG